MKGEGGGEGGPTVEEEREGIADDPALDIQAPGSSEHEEANEHDGGVLDQAPSSTNPVTDDTDEELADHDANDLKVRHGGDPVRTACLVGLPAGVPRSVKQGLEVADAEEDVALQTQTGTGQDGVAEVPTDRAQGDPSSPCGRWP